MKSSDVQFAEIMKRSENVKEHRQLVSKLTADILVAVLLIAMMVGTGLSIPTLKNAAAEVTENQYGSIYLVTPYLGYVIVGVLAFALGVCATILCIHIKKLKGKDD